MISTHLVHKWKYVEVQKTFIQRLGYCNERLINILNLCDAEEMQEHSTYFYCLILLEKVPYKVPKDNIEEFLIFCEQIPDMPLFLKDFYPQLVDNREYYNFSEVLQMLSVVREGSPKHWITILKN